MSPWTRARSLRLVRVGYLCRTLFPNVVGVDDLGMNIWFI